MSNSFDFLNLPYKSINLEFNISTTDIPQEIINYCHLRSISVADYLSALYCSFSQADLLSHHYVFSQNHSRLILKE